MTDAEITALAQAVERLLAAHGVELTCDRFNALDDYLGEIVRGIREDGQ